MISKAKKTLLHVAKSQLGLSDDEYREALRAHAEVDSSADPGMTNFGFKKVMQHFERCGFKSKNKKQRFRGKGVPAYKSKLTAKIFATCKDLGLPNAYADGIAKRMFSIDRVEWCDPDQLHKIVQCLAYEQKKRKGDVYR